MQTKEYRTFDKSGWGLGPWQNEPDKMQWQDEATGLPCLIVRNRMGALCGYVGVAERHPDFGKDYSDIDVEVHGGLTFASFCTESYNEAEHVCHVPDPDELDHVWWLGFDCSHCDDVAPQLTAYLRNSYGNTWQPTYKSISYVKAEIMKLAMQLKERAVASR